MLDKCPMGSHGMGWDELKIPWDGMGCKSVFWESHGMGWDRLLCPMGRFSCPIPSHSEPWLRLSVFEICDIDFLVFRWLFIQKFWKRILSLCMNVYINWTFCEKNIVGYWDRGIYCDYQFSKVVWLIFQVFEKYSKQIFTKKLIFGKKIIFW